MPVLPQQPMVMARRHMCVAGHYLATEAGAAMLDAGGNAVDAGVAAGIALGVVHSDQVQFSGVAPMLVYSAARDEVFSIAGLGYWPRAASLQLFRDRHGGGIPIGLLRTVVPAAPDAWITALAEFGTMSFSEVAAPAIRFGREGFTVHPVMAAFIERYRDRYRMWPGNAAIWLKDGEPPAVGDLLVQADLAAALQYMADEEGAASGGRRAGLRAARDAFYVGDIAKKIAAYHEENGGLLTAADLAGYRTPVEAPVSVEFAGTRVYSCRPWCQGPTLLQMLRILEGLDLAALGHNSADYIHTLAETIKLVFADREKYFGDPDVVDMPTDILLSEEYAAVRRMDIDSARAWPGMPPPGEIEGYGGPCFIPPVERSVSIAAADTSYACAVDSAGNVCSATPSDVSFEGPAIPGLGFCPSSRGSQSFAMAGHASAVAPGKRPRLTPNPALAVREGDFIMPFGTPGGDVQVQAMLQCFLNVVRWGMNPQQAIEAPRFATYSFPDSFEPHGSQPAKVKLESRIDEATASTLESYGHDVDWWPDWTWRAGAVCMIRKDQETGIHTGGADARRPAYAVGW